MRKLRRILDDWTHIKNTLPSSLYLSNGPKPNPQKQISKRERFLCARNLPAKQLMLHKFTKVIWLCSGLAGFSHTKKNVILVRLLQLRLRLPAGCLLVYVFAMNVWALGMFWCQDLVCEVDYAILNNLTEHRQRRRRRHTTAATACRAGEPEARTASVMFA